MLASYTLSDLVSQRSIFFVVNHEQVYREMNYFSQKSLFHFLLLSISGLRYIFTRLTS